MLLLPALKLKELLKVENIIREVKQGVFWHSALHFISAGKVLAFSICFSPSSCIHSRSTDQAYSRQKDKKIKLSTVGLLKLVSTLCGTFHSSHESTLHKTSLDGLYC